MKRIINYIVHDLLFSIFMGITSILPNNNYSTKIRGFIVKPLFKKCGKNFRIAPGVRILKIENISIGNDVYIAHNVWINAVGKLNLEDEVIISPNCVIDTSKHVYENGKITNKSYFEKISIGKGTWIAANTTIKYGIQIGNGCIVSANSCVTKSFGDYLMIGGVPAKLIKELR